MSRLLLAGPAAIASRMNAPGSSEWIPNPARVNPVPRRNDRREQSQVVWSSMAASYCSRNWG